MMGVARLTGHVRIYMGYKVIKDDGTRTKRLIAKLKFRAVSGTAGFGIIVTV